MIVYIYTHSNTPRTLFIQSNFEGKSVPVTSVIHSSCVFGLLQLVIHRCRYMDLAPRMSHPPRNPSGRSMLIWIVIVCRFHKTATTPLQGSPDLKAAVSSTVWSCFRLGRRAAQPKRPSIFSAQPDPNLDRQRQVDLLNCPPLALVLSLDDAVFRCAVLALDLLGLARLPAY